MAKNIKKIKKWEPEDFELEMTTHWSFPKRGDWATHDAKWRGNWSPYIPRNLLLRYSQEGELVLDQFAGGGTTLVEAKLLNRNIIGVDINDVALERCKEKIDFDYEAAKGRVELHKGDARNLEFISDDSIDFVVKTDNMIYVIETNFYSGGGSKLNETARSYKTLALESNTIDEITFVWFTDGKGWNSAKNNLKETFDVMEHIYNIKDLENNIISEVFK